MLQISKTIDPKIFDFSKYEDFINELCGERYFQKEAVRIVASYLLGKCYVATRDLALENFKENEKLQNFYKSFSALEDKLEFPDKLSCTVDLATATGKSYVMFGVAQILLSEGAVDQVLVLCPSVTIEKGLSEKFKTLSENKALKAVLPQNAIVNARKTGFQF